MPQTGLSQLGNVLLQGSADYANTRQRREAEDRLRANQLSDLQDQRAFATGQRDYERSLGLMDEARHREMAVDDATLQILLKEGWLKPTDARNGEAIQQAADARQAQLGATRTREAALPQKLQKEADYLGQQDAELSAVEDQLNAKLSAPAPSTPSPAEVRRMAIRMTNKPVPSDKEISDAIPAATDAIMQERTMRWYTEKEDAKTQIQLLRSQRTALRQSLTGLLQQGFVPDRPPPAPSVSLAAPGAGLRPATAAQAAAAAGGSSPALSSAPRASSAAPTSYGGLMALGPEMRTLGAALSDPVGSAEIAGRAAAGVPASLLNYFAGGERRVAEGDAERSAGMADALQRFNQPSRPMPANPFWQGNFTQSMPPLPALPPVRRSPALQFAPGY